MMVKAEEGWSGKGCAHVARAINTAKFVFRDSHEIVFRRAPQYKAATNICATHEFHLTSRERMLAAAILTVRQVVRTSSRRQRDGQAHRDISAVRK